MRGTRVSMGCVALAALAVAAAGCGSDSSPGTTEASSGSPAATDTRGKIRGCQDFAGTEPNYGQELTNARGRKDDGVMGKLVNEPGATIWVRPYVVSKPKECTLEAGKTIFFSRDSSWFFLMRNEAQDEGDKDWEYATQIGINDPYIKPQVEVKGAYNRLPGRYSWEQDFRQGETGSFIWGATKVEVKREKDNTYDSVFKSKTYTDDYGRQLSYMTSEMSDWANMTVTVKGLQ